MKRKGFGRGFPCRRQDEIRSGVGGMVIESSLNPPERIQSNYAVVVLRSIC